MTEDQIRNFGNELIDVYRNYKNSFRRYNQLRGILKPFINENGLVCNGGKIVFVPGDVYPKMDEEALKAAIRQFTDLGEETIEGIITRSKQMRFKEDYIRVDLDD